jgi:GNAT superfamily N-acetyltransferase
MLRRCNDGDFETIYAIINDAAQAYRGVIPADRWKQPYMSRDELRHEIDAGVVFWGFQQAQQLLGVMGLQEVGEVTLIRHAYIRTQHQRRGIGAQLLQSLCDSTSRPMLVGTWRGASWAISFYEKHGFRLVSQEQKDVLLNTYWNVPARQVETSVVLSNQPVKPLLR